MPYQQKKKASDSLLIGLRELDAGVMHHTSWLKGLHRAIVCGTEPSAQDLAQDAHCLCHFGQWYENNDSCPEMRANIRYAKIGVLHKAMHDQARTLLLQSSEGRRITSQEYDVFMDQAIHFRLEIGALQSEIINRICATDHLTGVWNRNGMILQLQQEHERMARNGDPCCICMMDLDFFKQVNDTHGHCVGDMVLHTASQFIKAQLRKYDSIFRFGGEEFLICLPGIAEEDAVLTLDRLREALAQLPIAIEGKEALHITASFGLASMAVDESAEDTIQKADHALLCAKAGGRNRVCRWGI